MTYRLLLVNPECNRTTSEETWVAA